MKLSRVRTIQLFALLIVLVLLVIVYPQNVIFIIFAVYALSGLLLYVPRFMVKNRRKRAGGTFRRGRALREKAEL
jgi:Flp pilus assembly protein TadB